MKHSLLFCVASISILISGYGQKEMVRSPKIFYVDAKKRQDSNLGTKEAPFHTLDKALKVVKARVEQGIRSDKIYLRAGRYKKVSTTTLYQLELKGTQDDFAVLSAMPCEPNTPGCIERKSGQWYEEVVFDDAYPIHSSWTKVPGKPNLWKTSPGFVNLEWTHQNLWPWRSTGKGFPLTKNDETSETTSFTVAPYMLLQNGEPTEWVQYVDSINQPGYRTYNHQTGELFVWPLGNKDPNDCQWDSWYGGEEDYEIGTLHLDGEGRAIFDGNLEYVQIQGFEFYMFNKIFELHRRKYHRESDRVIQRNVVLEDNVFRYGWIHILLDANTVLDKEGSLILPRYHDRGSWTARNNVYYRPSRECFQLHGDNHLFEKNMIIDHLGPWAGPAACVSAVNTRNTRNAMIRDNYILGHGKNKWHKGSVFMIEVAGEGHADARGDYKLGSQTYENNLLVDIEGPAIVLGKGDIRLHDITVRNNIFKDGKSGPAIQLSSAHWNLAIDNNVFYNQEDAILLKGQDGSTDAYQRKPSSISIQNNIFVYNKKHIDPLLLDTHPDARLYIRNNLFYENIQKKIGEMSFTQDPGFRSPQDLDFRRDKLINQIGPYLSSEKPETTWWKMKPDQFFSKE